MRLAKYSIAATELLLVIPAALFFAALFMRDVQPQQYEPAHTAQVIVTWYAARPRIGLWIFLMGLPLMVLVTGLATVVHSWTHDASLRQAARDTFATLKTHCATATVASATLLAAAMLAIVALHVATD
jgi:hypothetical protein